jgi:hypothetical protein
MPENIPDNFKVPDSLVNIATQLIPPHVAIPAASAAPIPKVLYPIYTSMGGTVLVWVAKQYLGLDIPTEVAVAIIGLAAGLVGYLTPLKARDIKGNVALEVSR